MLLILLFFSILISVTCTGSENWPGCEARWVSFWFRGATVGRFPTVQGHRSGLLNPWSMWTPAPEKQQRQTSHNNEVCKQKTRDSKWIVRFFYTVKKHSWCNTQYANMTHPNGNHSSTAERYSFLPQKIADYDKVKLKTNTREQLRTNTRTWNPDINLEKKSCLTSTTADPITQMNSSTRSSRQIRNYQ